MDLKELRRIVELMNEHGLTYFDMSREGFHLKLKKGQDLESLKGLMALLPAAAPAAAAPVAAAPAVAAPAITPITAGEEITSPMVGTFYKKPNPESPDFVSVGDTISVGQTLCIIEAMKVMNEIKAERTGTITSVLVEEGSPVQFGDGLFGIK